MVSRSFGLKTTRSVVIETFKWITGSNMVLYAFISNIVRNGWTLRLVKYQGYYMTIWYQILPWRKERVLNYSTRGELQKIQNIWREKHLVKMELISSILFVVGFFIEDVRNELLQEFAAQNWKFYEQKQEDKQNSMNAVRHPVNIQQIQHAWKFLIWRVLDKM